MKQLKTTVLMAMMLCIHATLSYSQSENPTPIPCTCNLGACSGTLASIDYTGIGGWASVLTTTGSMGIGLGAMYYFSTPGANYNRMITGIPSVTPHALNFIAECKIAISDGNSPGHYVMAITEKDEDPVSTNAAGYPLTNNDALAVVLKKEGAEPSSSSCCTNPCTPGQRWLLQILAKDGATMPVFSAGIPVRCQLTVTYYVRLVRSNCWTYLGVYSDPGFTTHVAGSPVCMAVPQTITGFRKLQHGVITWSSIHRKLSMTVDNTRICPYTTGCTPSGCSLTDPGDDQTKQIPLDNDISTDHHISITPNPSSGMFKLSINNADETITSIAIYDLNGKIYKLIDKVENTKALFINGNDLKNGIYMVEAYGKTKTWKSKIVIQR